MPAGNFVGESPPHIFCNFYKKALDGGLLYRNKVTPRPCPKTWRDSLHIHMHDLCKWVSEWVEFNAQLDTI